MDTTYDVAIVGTGRPHGTEGATGWGMSHAHARGYAATGRCRLVAVCDIVPDKARKFSDEHAGGEAAVFADYREMLAEAKPDVVSVCTWPHLHAPMVTACAEAAGVRAVHCEKPMAPTWGEARAMAAACKERGVQLTFNHQRRFLPAFEAARQLVRDGAIGDLVRIEGACANFFDWGTHWFDMFGYLNEESPAEWVIATVDARRPVVVYGVPMETQGVAQIRYGNGVHGLLLTGTSQDAVGCQIRALGSEGILELHGQPPHVRLKGGRGGAVAPEVEGEGKQGGNAISRGIADLIESLEVGRSPRLAADNALRATEVIFAAYESARRRGRVDLPLAIDDSPFRAMLDAGVFPDARTDDDRPVTEKMIR
jgi:predicted dehydrogenase